MSRPARHRALPRRRKALARAAPAVLSGLLLGAWVLAGHPAWGGEGMRGPGYHGTPRPPLGTHAPDYRPSRLRESPPPGMGFWLGFLAFYRTVVSPVDGDRCAMAPSCSLYSHEAIREHGIFTGILLTADRLLHEADEIPLAPKIVIDGETYYLDPIDNNTYWLD